MGSLSETSLINSFYALHGLERLSFPFKKNKPLKVISPPILYFNLQLKQRCTYIWGGNVFLISDVPKRADNIHLTSQMEKLWGKTTLQPSLIALMGGRHISDWWPGDRAEQCQVWALLRDNGLLHTGHSARLKARSSPVVVWLVRRQLE